MRISGVSYGRVCCNKICTANPFASSSVKDESTTLQLTEMMSIKAE